MEELEAFAAEVRRFKAWADDPAEGAPGVRAALIRLVALYEAALALPEPWHPGVESEQEPQRLADEEWTMVYRRVGKALPVGTYGVVSEPLVVPPEEAVLGDIGDDVADIYRDVVAGLVAFESGARLQARYEWSFGFQSHWGTHAVEAIRALHAYLVEESPAHLVNGA